MSVGYQAMHQPAHRLALPVGAGGACFRVFAAGGGGVTDLDLLLSSAEGEPLAGDVSGDTWPVLPPNAELCLNGPETYILEVAVTGGAGEYAVQVWGH